MVWAAVKNKGWSSKIVIIKKKKAWKFKKGLCFYLLTNLHLEK